MLSEIALYYTIYIYCIVLCYIMLSDIVLLYVYVNIILGHDYTGLHDMI